MIGDKDTVAGFSLVGVEGAVAHSRTEALMALKQAINVKDIGIILITETLADEIGSTIDELLSQKRCTLILRIPDMSGALEGGRTIEEFVLCALGVKV
ncbi:MAG: V-type ATP synthase subunit F [bacterium]